MRRIIILVLFLKSIEVFSQKDQVSEKDSPNERFDYFYFKLKLSKVSEKKVFPFNSVTVLDERLDTTKLGYSFINSHIPRKKFCFQDGTKKEISTFLHGYLHENYSILNNTLIVCLKKFWIVSYAKKDYDLFLKIEFYLKDDSCYRPLYRIDSMFSARLDLTTFIENALIQTTSRLDEVSIFEYKQLICVSSNQLEAFNQKPKQVPVLKEKMAAKGVYLNFEQFKNNRPAFTDFVVSFDNLTDIIYVKDHNGKDSSVINAWAISDGEIAYLKYGYNFFPLFRSGDNFDFYAFDKIVPGGFFPNASRPTSPYTNPKVAALDVGLKGILSSIRIKSKNLMPLQLDMENGEVY